MNQEPNSEKRPTRAWLAHEIVQLREMYERGESVGSIAKALDSTEWRVRRTATRYRIFRTPSSAAAHAMTPAWKRIKGALAERGALTQSQLHEFADVCPETISRELRVHRDELRVVGLFPTVRRPAFIWELLPIEQPS